MSIPRLVLTAEDDNFDAITTQHWKEEGFDVAYIPYRGRRKEYVREIDHLHDALELELGEKYAIVGRSHVLALGVTILMSLMHSLRKSGVHCPRPRSEANAQALRRCCILPRYTAASGCPWLPAQLARVCPFGWIAANGREI